MNTPRPPSPDATLTPEERALAGQIAQTRPPREPSQALDARILAAARAAAAPGRSNAPPHRRAHRRWPAVTAVAATLVLAVGIAWQLRPVDDTRVEYSEAPRAAARVAAPPGGPQASDDMQQTDTGETVVAEQAAAASVAPPPEPVAAQAESQRKQQPVLKPRLQEPAIESQPAPVEFEADFNFKSEAATEAPIVFDQPSPMDTATAPQPRPAPFPATVATPAPPPAPPAPAAPVRSQSTLAVPQAMSVPAADSATTGEHDRAARARRESKLVFTPPAGSSTATAIGTTVSEGAKAAATPETAAGALDRIEVTGTRIQDFADQPLDEQPPASADSPQVQQAWLQRVRVLIAQGDLDAARDSLREYRRRYPRAVLPDDLRALLAE